MFTVGDSVLALLPVVSSPFQVNISGSDEAVKDVSELDYYFKFLFRSAEKRILLCQLNLLKPYFDGAMVESELYSIV